MTTQFDKPCKDCLEFAPLQVVVRNEEEALAFVAYLEGGIFRTSEGFQSVESQTFDMSSYVVSGGAKLVTLEVDNEGDLHFMESGELSSIENATLASIPFPEKNRYTLAIFSFYENQEMLLNDDIRQLGMVIVDYPEVALANQIHEAPFETELEDDDEMGFWQATSELVRKITWENFIIQLTAIFGALFAPADHTHEEETIVWSPLTNGDPDNPELIFFAGDVIMIPEEM